ncbi:MULTISPECIES: hypothetical protein [Actinosynnema]|uniref:hypothetical protein n=1 Tax=Actinosynnema TaxID=40566 RepID=UPI0012FE40FA|nr:hypothetical protein [Actinosynnema pretiosum]MCP2098581.1 hypothetical protein [Actinosynnema pretiosum]
MGKDKDKDDGKKEEAPKGKNASSDLTGKAGTGPNTGLSKGASIKSPTEKNPKPANDQVQPDEPDPKKKK